MSDPCGQSIPAESDNLLNRFLWSVHSFYLVMGLLLWLIGASLPFLLVVASGSLSIPSDGERFLLTPLVSANDSTRSESPSKPDRSPCDGYDRLRCLVPQNPGSYLAQRLTFEFGGLEHTEDSSTRQDSFSTNSGTLSANSVNSPIGNQGSRTLSPAIATVAATGEIIGSIGNFSSMQRIIPCGKSLLYVSYGPCKYLGSNFCYAAYALTLFTYVLSVNHELIAELVKRMFKKDILLERNAYLITISMIPVMVIVTVFLAPLYGVIIWERKRILRTVNKSSASMSSRTKHMHTLLIQMLSLQAVMPGILVLAVITFILGQLGGTPTLFSSIIVIAHVRPYREGLREDLKIIYFFITPKCLQRARQNEEAQSTVVSARVSRTYGTAV
ncbi:hypothetical protein PRIPAC_96688 [Pristionchus pacificus]|uniref:G protein-coupled receptor n=1 Tax=Pristionchus pacificus TaxID=54126 RepID=A0A2A6B2U3_PRIPA|nr:hypothetical protein PRIPAC_96688 [Pristionchus pacificus]|eukprot:PDM60194.1 G protein-coupled receptor [Pristionchus pacificus]